MNIFSSLVTAHKRVLERARAQRAERQREADAELILEDIRTGFATQKALDKFAERDEYRSAIGEDFEGEL